MNFIQLDEMKNFNLSYIYSVLHIISSVQEREKAFTEIRLVRNHEEEKNKEQPDPPGGGAGPVKGVPLRQPQEEQPRRRLLESGKKVQAEEEEERGEHEKQLDLVYDPLQNGVIVDVPRDAHEHQHCGHEEAKVG
ncbi:unnamed protein product [Cuscuta epithymum]|uniref:Uncharacterized protein n=1 Tax=Cuscuta epithymum TaxID=186058 RepID=A0AAV0EXL1_9ASTE|nr:unnamed protein product [Cuscuta epithymum]